MKTEKPSIAEPRPFATCRLQPTQSHAHADQRNSLATSQAHRFKGNRRFAHSPAKGNPQNQFDSDQPGNALNPATKATIAFTSPAIVGKFLLSRKASPEGSSAARLAEL